MNRPSIFHVAMLIALAPAVTLPLGMAQAQPASSASASMPAGTTARATPSTKLARADEGFLKQAAQNGHAEVQSSKLAAGMTANPKVKTFAQQMVDDHTKAGEELSALAAAKGVKVPDRPSLAQRARIKTMGVLKGDSFDRSYAEQMGVSAHESTVKLFQRASTSATDPEVKAFAVKTLPTLQHHLEMARELKAATAGAKS